MKVLGISCFYHDSAACLIINGEIVAAAEEERFTRKKHDNEFPVNAISYCLEEAELESKDLDKVVFYEKPIQKFGRIMETAIDEFPRGYNLLSQALPEWLGKKLRFKKKLMKQFNFDGQFEFTNHHESHAASAFYPSPFEKAAVLTVDGIGERASNCMFRADEGDITPMKQITFPDSIGLLYSTITAFLGFMVNNGEYKVMGLASYGEPTYREEFKEFIDISEDGSYSLNMDYFAYTHKKQMWSGKFEELLGEPRKNEEEIEKRHKDLAATMQSILEEVIEKQLDHLYELTDTENLCMAGGVALNSACNGNIVRNSKFDNIWIQPAAGDAGGAMGAALHRSEAREYQMKDVYLGPSHNQKEIVKAVEESNLEYKEKTRNKLLEETTKRLENGKVGVIYQDRLEWGPRALGNRSIIADPRKEGMIDTVNQKVKFRESFRPFAPTVLEEYADEYFDVKDKSPYMLFVYNVLEEKQGSIPAVTHVNRTSRIQTLGRDTNPFYYDIIDSFRNKTGVPMVLNTSFNLKGMPIVNTPKEAINCMEESGIDFIVTPNLIIE